MVLGHLMLALCREKRASEYVDFILVQQQVLLMIIMIMDSSSSLCSTHTMTDPLIYQLTYPVDVRKLLFIYLFIYSFIHLFIYLCTCLFIYLFLCLVVYEIQLLSTWGDQYYVGLTGIEIKDQENKTVPLLPSSK